MTRVHRNFGVLVFLAAAACGGGSKSTPAPAPNPSPSPMPISGRERIAWTQIAATTANYVFLLYVDDVRNELTTATCAPAGESGFECQAQLPPMSNGTHTLQLAAAVREGDVLAEGPRSASIVVNVTGSIAGPAGTIQLTGAAPRGSAGSAAAAEARRTAIDRDCGMSRWDDSSVLAWSAAGELAFVDASRRSVRALAWKEDLLGDGWRLESVMRVERADGPRLLAVFTAADGDAARLRVVRYREVNGVLGERAVLLDTGVSPRPARISGDVGPDARVYLSLVPPAPRPTPAPFVVMIGADDTSPLQGEELRFQSAAPIDAAWASDGQFWILEADGGGYAVRATDARTPLWRLSSSEPPTDLQAMGAGADVQLIVFAGAAPAWRLWPATARASSLSASARPSGAMSRIVGTAAVSCQGSPRLRLSFDRWPR